MVVMRACVRSVANEQGREKRLVIITRGRSAIRLNPLRVLCAERIAGPPPAAACSITTRRHNGKDRMNKLGDPASSRELGCPLGALCADRASLVEARYNPELQ